MNREIKFRVWDGKKIIYTDTASRVMNDSGGHPYLPFYLHQHTFDNKNIIIEQFTGLKDIKGKDIYEGDIIKIDLNIAFVTHIVKFEKGAFCVGHEPTNLGNFCIPYYKIEIVGNIHENLNYELLKN